jgi:FtsP/CotA-like multicopper oxidase with cupredoxin domain
MSRRQLLSLTGAAATGLVALSVVGCGDDDEATQPGGALGGSTPSPAGGAVVDRPNVTVTDPGWRQPAVLSSANGVLNVTLTVKAATVPHAGNTRWAITVNGTTPGPTLRIRPGDRLRIVFDNQLVHSTNLHTHGLRVSPTGNADNPFIEIKAGEKFTYEMQIPDDHPSGLFWYHPHLHHHVAEQIFAGMFGAIIVEDAIDRLPELVGATERMVLIHDTRDAATESGVTSATMMDQMDGRQGNLILVNGIANQTMAATAGKLERWRLLNASASRFYRLKVDGHSLNVISRDGGRLSAPEQVEELILVPGERAEVLIQPVNEGVFRLRSLTVNRGAMGASSELQLATMNVAAGASNIYGLPVKLATVADVNGMKVVRTREVTLEMRTGGGPPRFLVSGKAFDPNRVDVQVKLGTVEDWMVRNAGSMDHPFHLHIWPFQVVERSAPGPVPKGWKDVVNVPAGGFVRIRIPFEQIGGKTVFHCHILDHEDQGMMAVVEAV